MCGLNFDLMARLLSQNCVPSFENPGPPTLPAGYPGDLLEDRAPTVFSHLSGNTLP